MQEGPVDLIHNQITECYQLLWQDIGGLDQASEGEVEDLVKELAELITLMEKHPKAAASLLGTEAWETDLNNIKYHAVQLRKVLPLLAYANAKLQEIDPDLEEHLRNMDDIERPGDDEMCGKCMNTICTCGGNGKDFHRVGGII